MFIILTVTILLGVGRGDVAYNSRRGILAAIPVPDKIAYHLFNVDAYASNTKEIVKLNRKSKWHSQYSTREGNWFLFAAKHPFITFSYLLITLHLVNLIAGFDFNPAGESFATIDSYGMCLISDVNTNNCEFHLQVGSQASNSEF